MGDRGANDSAPGFDRTRPQFYGRRHGHRLRPRQKRLMETLLPTLRVPLSDDGEPLDPARLFDPKPDAVWMEVGFGGGEHLVHQALANPDVGFIGCEPFVNGVASFLARSQSDDIGNVRVFDDDVRKLFPALSPASLDRVFILFPDPWPKKRHHRRRLIVPETLDQLARLMKGGAELRFASDHGGYVAWALERIRRHPDFQWLASRPGDWRRRPDDWAETRYEAKALAAGATCTYLRFRRL